MEGEDKLTTIIWLIFALWIVLLMITFRKNDLIWVVTSSIIGLFFGINLVNETSLIIGVSIILLNVALLWKGLFKEMKKA